MNEKRLKLSVDTEISYEDLIPLLDFMKEKKWKIVFVNNGDILFEQSQEIMQQKVNE